MAPLILTKNNQDFIFFAQLSVIKKCQNFKINLQRKCLLARKNDEALHIYKATF